MTDLKDVQQLVVDTIEAGPAGATDYFDNDAVILEDGKQSDNIESALNSRGVAYVVEMPISADIFQTGPGVTICYVDIIVSIKTNPIKNISESGANVNVLEAVQYVTACLLGYNSNSNNEEENFTSSDIPFHLVNYDEGLIEYILAFRKLVALSSS